MAHHSGLGLWLLVSVGLTASSVQASTLPPVDFKQSDRKLSVGMFDASFDYAPLEKLSIGASFVSEHHQAPDISLLFVPRTLALRATYRFWDGPTGLCLGATLSGGTTFLDRRAVMDSTSLTYGYWLQPALNLTLPIVSPHLTLRATTGPSFDRNFTIDSLLWRVWPSVEVAYRFNQRHELTLGGNSLLGWRGTF